MIVPGHEDPGSDLLLPQFELPDFFFDALGPKNRAKVHFATNPCRISYYGKTIVVSRTDLLRPMKKNALVLGGDLANPKPKPIDESD